MKLQRAKKHMYLLNYIRNGEEDVYEFSAYTQEQATLIATMYCQSHDATPIGLELTCIASAEAV